YVGDKPIVIARDEDGSIHVFVNKCAHRGVQFCRADFGNAGEFICPYHQWTYNLKGELIGVPFRRGLRGQGGMPADFVTSEHEIRKLAVAVRNGVIFASFDHATPPLEDYLGARMISYFDRVFDGRELRVLEI